MCCLDPFSILLSIATTFVDMVGWLFNWNALLKSKVGKGFLALMIVVNCLILCLTPKLGWAVVIVVIVFNSVGTLVGYSLRRFTDAPQVEGGSEVLKNPEQH